MYVLTIMSTVIYGNYFNRTDKVKEYLEVYNDSFLRRDEILDRLETVGILLASFAFARGSFWLRKANFFTLTIELLNHQGAYPEDIDARLAAFERQPPARYLLAQREAVNSRRERVLRGVYLRQEILGVDEGLDREDPLIDAV